MSALSGLSTSPGALDLLTTGDAAILCGVDARTIARWADAGALPTHRTLGGRRRIRRSDLETFMHRQGIPMPTRRGDEPLRIAIVDDDPLVVRGFARVVTKAFPGVAIGRAFNGFDAGVLIAQEKPHLVLLDLVMPGLSGLEVCASIRSRPSLGDTRIIVISGHLAARVRQQLGQAGADACLEKPVSSRVLVDTIARLLGRVVAVGALAEAGGP